MADYVDALLVMRGQDPPPSGYTKIEQDLNQGASGEYLYLCYHHQKPQSSGQNTKAVTDLYILLGQGSAPPGYEKIDVDLNAGAGGDYIYLCYKIAPWQPSTAILDVAVIAGDDPSIPPPLYYKKIDVDLNKGAGGKYIYICYRKQN